MKSEISYLYLFIFAGLLLILSGCSSSRTNNESENEAGTKQAKQINKLSEERIPAGHCRVIATVLSIDDTALAEDEASPCSQAHCLTEVHIDKVLGYGSGFNQTVSENQKLLLRFAFTTSSTKTLGLDLDQHLPGVEAGDRVRADIEYRPVFGGDGEYVVYWYEVVSD